MPHTENLYTLLNVEDNCSSLQIRESYKRLMLLHHPDKTSDKFMIERGTKILEAYNILIDPIKREQYNRKEKRSGEGNVRYVEIVDFREEIKNDNGVSVECYQCLGKTDVELCGLRDYNEGKGEIYLNCSHCGLMMKLE